MPARTAVFSARSTLRRAILDLGPVEYWPLDEKSGTVAVDAMGANPGTYVGSPALGVPGPDADGGTGVALDGITQCVTTAAGPPSMTAVSCVIWFKRAGAPAGSGDKTLHNLAAGIMGDLGYPRVYVIDATGMPGAQFRDSGGTTRSVAGSVSVGDGAYHMVVFTHDGTVGRMYVDGIAAATPAVYSLRASSTSPPTIGRYTAGASQTNGSLAHVAVFPRALSAGEVAAIYAASRG